MLAKRFCTISISILLSSFLVGCNNEGTVSSSMEKNGFLSVKSLHLENEKEFKFERGIYLLCIDKEAYIAGSQNVSLLTQVTNKGHPVLCKGENNSQKLLVKSLGVGMRNLCIGGYEFMALAEGERGNHVLQKFNPNGEAKFCVPNISGATDFDNMPIIHPALDAKRKDIEKILSSSEQGNKTGIY